MTGLWVAVGLAALVTGCRGDAVVEPKGSPSTPASEARKGTPLIPMPAQAEDGSYLGVVLARESVEVASKFEGRLESVLVRLGDQVEQGSRIGTLDVRSVEKDLDMAEASLRAAQADREEALVQLAVARDRHRRLSQLQNLVSIEELTTAQNQEKSAAAKLENSDALIAEKKARVGQLKETLAETEIRAPFRGIVAARYLDPGATVARGTPIVRLITMDELRVRFAVPEEKSSQLAVGVPVTASIDAAGTVIPGRVESVAPEVDSASRMVLAEARLAPAGNWKGRIPSGAVARVRLSAEERAQKPVLSSKP